MATSSGRLVALFAISLVALVTMPLCAALVVGRNPLLEAGVLLPPALTFCVAGWFGRNRPTLLTILLIVVASLSGICIVIYLLDDLFGIVIVWGLQWIAAFATIVTAIIVYVSGDSSKRGEYRATEQRQTNRLGTTLFGFALGVALGLALCFTVIQFEYHSGSINDRTTVYVFGADLFSLHGIFANLAPFALSVVICGATGIAGTLASRYFKRA